MTGRVFSLFLSLAVSLVAAAQPSTAVASRDAMLYETSTHLCLQADTLTCISMDMEWPKGLDGSLLPELQHSLTTFFSGSRQTVMRPAGGRSCQRMARRSRR